MNNPGTNKDSTGIEPENSQRKILVGPRHDREQKTEITLEKNGDTVQVIRIACRCGEETKIKCSYPDDKG